MKEMKEKIGKGVQISTILSDDDFEKLRIIAFEKKMSISSYLRHLIKQKNGEKNGNLSDM